MITRIREVRRARGMTLDDVAQRCEPPTTPQTIGRLETGTRTVSVGWLNRIARALGVEAQDLVERGETRSSKSRRSSAPGGAQRRSDRGDRRSTARRPRPGRDTRRRQRRRLSRGRRNLVRRARSPKITPARSTATCWCRAPPAASCSAA